MVKEKNEEELRRNEDKLEIALALIDTEDPEEMTVHLMLDRSLKETSAVRTCGVC